MSSQIKTCVHLFFFIWVVGVSANIYYPGSCANRCSNGDFISKLPLDSGPVNSGDDRAYAWAIMTLIQIKRNFEIISPPSAARVCAIMGTCLYEAAALGTQNFGSNFEPSFKFPDGSGQQEMVDAIDGAAFWALKSLFGERPSFADVYSQYERFAGRPLDDVDSVTSLETSTVVLKELIPPLEREAAMQLGAVVCQRVIAEYTADGFSARGDAGGEAKPVNYAPVNAPQRRAGVTDCDAEMNDLGRWQPLCIPNGPDSFGTEDCTPQKFIYPWAGLYNPYALISGDENSGHDLVPPPPAPGTPHFKQQWETVLEISSRLGDAQKVVAEYWADGPDTTMPAGHLWRIAADAARSERLSIAETARLLFIVGNAVYDAGIASWRTKTSYDYVRPLQMIQCGDYRDQMREAWMGPYLGTGFVNISEWRPYQATFFISPGFAAYVSGHSTFSAAGAEALRLFFGDDRYRGPSCDRILTGESLFEPKSNAIPGISDEPNTGPGTPGYVPAEDVIICWDTFTAATRQSGMSRLYGGIHIERDDSAGQELGRRVGKAVFQKAAHLFR